MAISVRILSGRRDAFVAGISRHAAASVGEEPGCLRFGAAADSDGPALFRVREVVADEAAPAAHLRARQREKAAAVVPGSHRWTAAALSSPAGPADPLGG
ncbi:putative quinol monooxygenase [Nocardiopsis sp. CNT312]|uniref:putative quinol monooxygenase n=1 Tax=Nocardiopsis sp. CNT312 TaxID=1137268 RepID=UPI0004B97CAD|nr:antibiotic biosynthesis monooxygenase [Nocardiopsis sp. CNT312]